MVRLSEVERKTCQEVIRKLKGNSQKARRARILLQVDANGPDWSDHQVAEACDGRERTVANVRKRCVPEDFEWALDGRQRDPSNWPPKRLDGRQEVALIALRLGPRRPATANGPCGCWPARRSRSASVTRSATKPSIRHSRRR